MSAIGRTSEVCSQICRELTVHPMDDMNMTGRLCITYASIARAIESNMASISPSVIVIVIIGRIYP